MDKLKVSGVASTEAVGGVSPRRPVGSFKDLMVWEKGISLVEKVYAVTDRFPSAEKFGLITKLRRAAVSVPSNVA